MLSFSSSFDEYPAGTTNFYKSTVRAISGASLLPTSGVQGGACINLTNTGTLPQYNGQTGFSNSFQPNVISCGAWFQLSVGLTGTSGQSAFLIGSDVPRTIVAATYSGGIASGGLDIYDSAASNVGEAAVLISSNIKGPNGQVINDGNWHYIEVQLNGVQNGAAMSCVQKVAVDGIVWSTITLNQSGTSYQYQYFCASNNGVSAGSTINVDDFIVWDDLQPLGYEFTGTTPIVSGGGVYLTTLIPTADSAVVGPAFPLVGGATFTSCVNSKFTSLAANTSYWNAPTTLVDSPANAIIMAGAVTYTGAIVPSQQILAAQDWAYVYESFAGEEQVIRVNARFYGIDGAASTVTNSLSIDVQDPGSEQSVDAFSYGSQFSSGSTPWTPTTLASVPTQFVLQANNPASGQDVSTLVRVLSVQRDVLTSHLVLPQQGKYVVICNA